MLWLFLRRSGGGLGRWCGELGEIGRGAPVDFRYRVSVVAQGGGAAAAVAEPGGCVAEVDSAREQLAGRVVAQSLDVQPDARLCSQIGYLMRCPVGIPRD